MFARWENLSRDQLNALDKEKTIVLLPLSAMEQHGPHLPVGTDTLILKELIDRTIAASGEFAECDVIFAPQMPVGKSNEHMDFCGTMTFSAKTYYSVIYDLAKSIAHHGFQKLILRTRWLDGIIDSMDMSLSKLREIVKGQESLECWGSWICKESDTTEPPHFHFSLSCIGEGNGKPLQCSCLENPRTWEPGGLLSLGSHRVGQD